MGQEGGHQRGRTPAESVHHGEADHQGVVNHHCRDVGDAGVEGLQATVSRGDAQDGLEDHGVGQDDKEGIQAKSAEQDKQAVKAVEGGVCTREPDQVGVQAVGVGQHVGPAEGQASS